MAKLVLLMYMYSGCIFLFYFFIRIEGEHWVHKYLATIRIVISYKAFGAHRGWMRWNYTPILTMTNIS